MAKLEIKDLIVQMVGLTTGTLLRRLTTSANKYSRAVVEEAAAQKVKSTERANILALMDSLGTNEQNLARFRVLILEKGGDMDYALAQEHLDSDTLESVTTYRIDEALAVASLDADTLASIRVPVVDHTKARKLLDKPTIKSIILKGTTTVAINVNSLRAK